MHDWLGFTLVALGLGLVGVAVQKRRIRTRTVLAAGSILGAQAGARLLARADERKLKLAFGAFMLIVAAFMVVGR